MRSIRKGVLVVLLLVAASAVAFAEYNQAKVVAAMRSSVQLIGEIRTAATAKNYFLAAEKLYAIATGMREILPYTPPKGTKAYWEKTMTEFVNTAYIGIGACGAQDAERLNQAVARLAQLQGQGHAAFR